LGDSAVPEDKKKQIIAIIILIIIVALIFFFLYSSACKKLPFFAGNGASVVAKGTVGLSTQSGSAVKKSSDTQDISTFEDEYTQQEQLNFENGQKLSTAERHLSQTGSIFSSGQSTSQQGQSTSRQSQ
jgi:cell shape-determining protein MreC